MKNFIRTFRTNIALVFLFGLAACLGVVRGDVTLEDFGFGSMKVGLAPAVRRDEAGAFARLDRPLLVVRVEYDGWSGPLLTAGQLEQLVFSPGTPPTQPPSVVSYFDENSNGRFHWVKTTPAVVTLHLPRSETVLAFNYDDSAFASNILRRVVEALPGDLSEYDSNRDNRITSDELQLLVFHNQYVPTLFKTKGKSGAGAARPPGCVNVAGKRQICQMLIPQLAGDADFATIVHELSHCLGALDLYEPYLTPGIATGKDSTLMGATISAPYDTNTLHLDPWHKMQLGWSEPRIHALQPSGFALIPAAQAGNPNGPVLLYDPARGTEEFFLLEYRTRDSDQGPGYDKDFGSGVSGLVIWHVRQNSNHRPVGVLGQSLRFRPGQPGWFFCKKCQGLHYAGGTPGVCPADGQAHSTEGSWEYLLIMNSRSTPGEHGWRWCRKCQGCFYDDIFAFNVCPADHGRHDGSASADYSFRFNLKAPDSQSKWRRCSRCQGMFAGPGADNSVCPAGPDANGSSHHNPTGSADYVMAPVDPSVVTEAMFPGTPTTYLQGGSTAWGAGLTTPTLRWFDGGDAGIRLKVHPFSEKDRVIPVEWIPDRPVWADFQYRGLIELGTFDAPFNTFDEGVQNAYQSTPTLRIKPGSSPETYRINKSLRIEAFQGPVTIGRR